MSSVSPERNSPFTVDDEARRLERIRPNLERRALICRFTREFFQNQGFHEVETPVRVPVVAPELQIVPLESEGWYLSTSPELYMKRLLAAGYDRLFQVSRCFRKGERGRWHNPEFTLLEWYRAGADYLQMVRDTQDLVLAVTRKLGMGPVITYRNRKIDLTPPWPSVTVRGAFLSAAGWDPVTELDPLRFDTDLVTKVLPAFDPYRPTVLLDYPAAMASLACLKSNEPLIAERAEVFIGGLELANAYSELTDAAEQTCRFQAEIKQIEQERGRKTEMPWPFLQALTRLPACGGIALGMDRLMMLLCDADSIDQVVAFTVDTA
ncbi:MAG: EF-P lysine aminoacylase GenX [Chloroflexi bacterium]|nr:EF-P lysine aminoacylase GenX [Chloroflexota bacterium]